MAIPFVLPSELELGVERIQTLFHETDLLKPWNITVSQTDVFHHKDSATVYLKPDEYSIQRLQAIRKALNSIFRIPTNHGDELFRPHLTIGQTALDTSVSHLQRKAEILLPISWPFEFLAVVQKNETDGGRMEIFATVPQGNALLQPQAWAMPFSPCCFSYDGNSRHYTMYQSSASLFDELGPPPNLTISTYNILHSPYQPQVEASPRLRLLLDVIIRQASTLLILQEVTDIAWDYFLSDPSLREKFPYVSAPAHLPLPNHRNIVLLSSIPFKAHYLHLFTAHKPALIIDVDGIVVAGVHLHAGLHEEKLALKLKELSKLTSYLESTGKPVIIAGDFNIPNIPREYTAALPKINDLLGHYVDAWVENPSGDGDTFSPDTNRFAKEGAKVLYPQRHDRVYFSRGVGIHVEKTSLFGFPEKEDELASDHWGLSVHLHIDPDERPTTETTEITVTVSLDVPKTIWDDKLVLQTLTDANDIPDNQHDRKLKSVVALLNVVLSPMRQHFPFKLQVVGSFALGVHTTSSDIDILVVSTISQKTFWEVFLQHIQRFKLSDPTNRVKVLRIIRSAKQPLVELLVDTCRVEVLYCSAGKLINTYRPIHAELIIVGNKFPRCHPIQIFFCFLHRHCTPSIPIEMTTQSYRPSRISKHSDLHVVHSNTFVLVVGYTHLNWVSLEVLPSLSSSRRFAISFPQLPLCQRSLLQQSHGTPSSRGKTKNCSFRMWKGGIRGERSGRRCIYPRFLDQRTTS